MRRSALLVLVLAPLLASCSGSASSSDAGSKTMSAPHSARAQAVSAPSMERSVVRTARISVHVKDTGSAADKAAALAVRQQGRVDSDERSQAGEGSAAL